jgi:hypothetical protein
VELTPLYSINHANPSGEFLPSIGRKKHALQKRAIQGFTTAILKLKSVPIQVVFEKKSKNVWDSKNFIMF